MSEHRCPACRTLCGCDGVDGGGDCTHAYDYPDDCNRGMDARDAGYGLPDEFDDDGHCDFTANDEGIVQ